MHTIIIHGLSWHAQSPSRLVLLGYHNPPVLAFDGKLWVLQHPSFPIPLTVGSRDIGAQMLARHLAGARGASITEGVPS
jgi:hypothetical protein